MTSKAEAIFTCKRFNSNLLPNDKPDVGINTVLKKRQGDATLSLQFSDASLRDPKSGKGLILAAEKPLACEWRDVQVKPTPLSRTGAVDPRQPLPSTSPLGPLPPCTVDWLPLPPSRLQRV
jgi:hypothetical protein